MTYLTDAIYEGSVLHTLNPLNLKEQEVVSLAITTSSESDSTQIEVARQHGVLAAYLAKVESNR